jgi:hypothetical protein
MPPLSASSNGACALTGRSLHLIGPSGRWQVSRNWTVCTVQAFDPGEGTFEQKLKLQIGGGSPAGIQLMAEIHFVYYLPESGGVTAETPSDDHLADALGGRARLAIYV